jgi:hypothetical protein
MKKSSVLAAALFIVVVLGAILYTSFGGTNSKYRVEICIAFQGLLADGQRTVRVRTVPQHSPDEREVA